ncbi:hypothetical protein DOH34_12970 [Salmonella enterica subsp. enterica serovar Wangata]|uniref:Uncharacterized protein n=1 Tax=Salmonella muenchen TaxID=596 RepID=A0A5W3IPF7_SALMU|nr:hypothetical protein [Salmonella enterica subsp. enterica serovar Wangata]EBW6611154.1 hypothetical protein [Salmonella enterica subsp. enterica serovar Muenchen]
MKHVRQQSTLYLHICFVLPEVSKITVATPAITHQAADMPSHQLDVSALIYPQKPPAIREVTDVNDPFRAHVIAIIPQPAVLPVRFMLVSQKVGARHFHLHQHAAASPSPSIAPCIGTFCIAHSTNLIQRYLAPWPPR